MHFNNSIPNQYLPKFHPLSPTSWERTMHGHQPRKNYDKWSRIIPSTLTQKMVIGQLVKKLQTSCGMTWLQTPCRLASCCDHFFAQITVVISAPSCLHGQISEEFFQTSTDSHFCDLISAFVFSEISWKSLPRFKPILFIMDSFKKKYNSQ